jgi:hypothetical protein
MGRIEDHDRPSARVEGEVAVRTPPGMAGMTADMWRYRRNFGLFRPRYSLLQTDGPELVFKRAGLGVFD